MIKNNIKNLIVIFLSFIFIYILADMILIPSIFYVRESVVPNVINQNISTAKTVIEDSGLEFRIQYIPSESADLIGTIINSVPSNGKKVKSGTIIDLKVFGDNWNTKDGSGVRDYIHIMDLSEGHLDALSYIKDNKSCYEYINLGSGKGYSVFEIINEFE